MRIIRILKKGGAKGKMKRRLNLTIDDDVYKQLGELPRKISVSEIVSWTLRSIVESTRPGGMSTDEFREFMLKDEKGREVFNYMHEMLSPVYDVEEAVTKKVKDICGRKKKGNK